MGFAEVINGAEAVRLEVIAFDREMARTLGEPPTAEVEQALARGRHHINEAERLVRLALERLHSTTQPRTLRP
jgi:hypothetical protein